MIFAKAHGTGNDFVVLPDPYGELDLTPQLAAALCDRRRGIGGDGVLRVVRADRDPDGARMAGDADWFMDYRNADGSIAEMCGNGVRAYARYLVTSGLMPAATARMPIATRAGVVEVEIGPEMITVGLDRPRVGGSGTATVAGSDYPGLTADVGNPHLVCPVSDAAALDALDLGRTPEHSGDGLPAEVNVEFVAPGEPVEDADTHVHMRVFERGVGETLSCGSGACAVGAVALHRIGRRDGVVAVDVPGGRLTITLNGDRCLLSGPAVVVATGEVDVTSLLRTAVTTG
ncbi:MAG TPA: diaminopimelate epimerase [Micromonosporaceae bacterium]|nr:diaminopimelate epimerase [Micromonosporaceae bacterium]